MLEDRCPNLREHLSLARLIRHKAANSPKALDAKRRGEKAYQRLKQRQGKT